MQGYTERASRQVPPVSRAHETAGVHPVHERELLGAGSTGLRRKHDGVQQAACAVPSAPQLQTSTYFASVAALHTVQPGGWLTRYMATEARLRSSSSSSRKDSSGSRGVRREGGRSPAGAPPLLLLAASPASLLRAGPDGKLLALSNRRRPGPRRGLMERGAGASDRGAGAGAGAAAGAAATATAGAGTGAGAGGDDGAGAGLDGSATAVQRTRSCDLWRTGASGKW